MALMALYGTFCKQRGDNIMHNAFSNYTLDEIKVKAIYFFIGELENTDGSDFETRTSAVLDFIAFLDQFREEIDIG